MYSIQAIGKFVDFAFLVLCLPFMLRCARRTQALEDSLIHSQFSFAARWPFCDSCFFLACRILVRHVVFSTRKYQLFIFQRMGYQKFSRCMRSFTFPIDLNADLLLATCLLLFGCFSEGFFFGIQRNCAPTYLSSVCLAYFLFPVFLRHSFPTVSVHLVVGAFKLQLI